MRAGDDFATVHNAAAAAGAQDDAKHQLFPLPRPVKRLGQCKTVGVVLNFNFAAEPPFEVGPQRPAVQADRVGIFQQTRARGNRPRRPDAERVRLAVEVSGEVVMERFDAVQDAVITQFLPGLDAFAVEFPALPVQDDAFNLGAAEINADA